MQPLDPDEDDFARRLRDALALPDAPAALQRAAIDLWRAPPVGAPSLLRRIAASLAFDSWAPGAPALGMRSLPSSTRHLLFSAAGRDIDLRIAPVGERFALAGQVLGPDAGGEVAVEPLEGTGAVERAPLDELGEFRIDAVQRGRYRLVLRSGDEELVVEPVEVGGRRD